MSEEKSLTLGCNNDQTLVQTEPTAFKGNGNPTGDKTCTITGDHANRVTDFTPLVCEYQADGFISRQSEKARSLGYVENGTPTIKATNIPDVVCYPINGMVIGKDTQNGGNSNGFKEDVAYTQETVAPQGVAFRGSVRRLMPIECERLMGFPPNWTRIAWRGKPPEECPDAPRYKACGNSMCVNCMRWIGLGIEMVESKLKEAK
jgi:site-specific DNA-cytosine methylase